MKIEEHLVGSKVRLLYLGKEHDDIFNTEIVTPIEEPNQTNHIICNPIRVNEQPVLFTTLGLIAEITQLETGRVYRYAIYNCGHFVYKGETFFALFSKDDARLT